MTKSGTSFGKSTIKICENAIVLRCLPLDYFHFTRKQQTLSFPCLISKNYHHKYLEEDWAVWGRC